MADYSTFLTKLIENRLEIGQPLNKIFSVSYVMIAFNFRKALEYRKNFISSFHTYSL